MDTQWELWFKQHGPPTEDHVIRMNMEEYKNPKPIYVSKKLDLDELQNLIEIIQEYMDVFA